METIVWEKKGHFCWVKLNRPDALNALNTQMAKDLLEASQEVALDREVWVVGLTTTSEKSFGVGADLKERNQMSVEDLARQRVLFVRAMNSVRHPQPVIAGVKGFALGEVRNGSCRGYHRCGKTPSSACRRSGWA
jgi:enoyl-CoA hydratase/carnithine racemase